MGLLGTGLGRALGGAARGTSEIANKYIDDQLARQRDEALADLKVRTSGRLLEQEDAFRNDPARVARDRENKRQDTLAEAGARDEATLRTYSNAPLNEARRAVATADSAAATDSEIAGERRKLAELTPAQIEAKNATTRGTMGAEAERAGLLAEAQYRQQARFREPRVGSGEKDPWEKVPPLVKEQVKNLGALIGKRSDDIAKAQAEGSWDPDKNPSQAALRDQVASLQGQYDRLIAAYTPRMGGNSVDDANLRDLTPQPSSAGAQKPTGGEPVPKAKEPGKPSEGFGAKLRGLLGGGASTEAPVAPARAAAPAGAPAAGGGQGDPDNPKLLGIGPVALRRIARDPNHPLRADAAAKIARESAASNDLQQQRMDEADRLAPY